MEPGDATAVQTAEETPVPYHTEDGNVTTADETPVPYHTVDGNVTTAEETPVPYRTVDGNVTTAEETPVPYHTVDGNVTTAEETPVPYHTVDGNVTTAENTEADEETQPDDGGCGVQNVEGGTDVARNDTLQTTAGLEDISQPSQLSTDNISVHELGGELCDSGTVRIVPHDGIAPFGGADDAASVGVAPAMASRDNEVGTSNDVVDYGVELIEEVPMDVDDHQARGFAATELSLMGEVTDVAEYSNGDSLGIPVSLAAVGEHISQVEAMDVDADVSSTPAMPAPAVTYAQDIAPVLPVSSDPSEPIQYGSVSTTPMLYRAHPTPEIMAIAESVCSEAEPTESAVAEAETPEPITLESIAPDIVLGNFEQSAYGAFSLQKAPDAGVDEVDAEGLSEKAPDAGVDEVDAEGLSEKTPDAGVDEVDAEGLSEKTPDAGVDEVDGEDLSEKAPDAGVDEVDAEGLSEKTPDAGVDEVDAEGLSEKTPDAGVDEVDAEGLSEKAPDAGVDEVDAEGLSEKAPDVIERGVEEAGVGEGPEPATTGVDMVLPSSGSPNAKEQGENEAVAGVPSEADAEEISGATSAEAKEDEADAPGTNVDEAASIVADGDVSKHQPTDVDTSEGKMANEDIVQDKMADVEITLSKIVEVADNVIEVPDSEENTEEQVDTSQLHVKDVDENVIEVKEKDDQSEKVNCNEDDDLQIVDVQKTDVTNRDIEDVKHVLRKRSMEEGITEDVQDPKKEASSTTKPGQDGESKKTKSEGGSGKSKTQQCVVCNKVVKCKFNIVRNGDIKHLCDDSCFKVFRASPTQFLRGNASTNGSAPTASITRTGATPVGCAMCKKDLSTSARGKFVFRAKPATETELCTEKCLETYRQTRKLCATCERDVTDETTAFVSPMGKGAHRQYRDYCSQRCLSRYHKQAGTSKDSDNDVQIIGTTTPPAAPTNVSRGRAGFAFSCAVCNKFTAIKHEVNLNRKLYKLCSDRCFSAFRYVNKLPMSPCDNCGIYCHDSDTSQNMQYQGETKRFCSAPCVSGFKKKNVKIATCSWCATKKSNFDMVERVDDNNKVQLFCTLRCLSLYRVNLQATSNQSIKCDQCHKMAPAQYHLTMSDASVRNFCSYTCVVSFQGQFSATPKHGATGSPAGTSVQNQAQAANRTRTSARVAARHQPTTPPAQSNIPVISNVISLSQPTGAPGIVPVAPGPRTPTIKVVPPAAPTLPAKSATPTQTTVTQKIIIQPPQPKAVKNKSLMCRPLSISKATSCKPHCTTKGTQTDDDWEPKKLLIPVPVPLYIPAPMAMYSVPQPYPVPIPIPIPIPMFIPTTKKSADSILRHVKEIQERMPADPFEAEMLMMAEAVATAEKGDSDSDSDSDGDTDVGVFTPKAETETVLTEATPSETPHGDLGEDMLQMALRMASEMPDEPIVDLEESLHPTPVLPGGDAIDDDGAFTTIGQGANEILTVTSSSRGRRGRGRGGRGARARPKRARLEDPSHGTPASTVSATPGGASPAADANMVLKYTYGVNAWKHWVTAKNQQLDKVSATTRGKLKLFKANLLQCTADELNFSLCLFVKEVRKPNGEEYAPDSIFYLCLGIQQYLFVNGRIDNIYTDIYFEKFTECLNEVLTRYEVRLNAQGMIVCRIEEEHLWESKQLGAHSPYILLNTLIYFNTKYFMLRTPEDHLKLSFSHIMKHWKRTGAAGSGGVVPTVPGTPSTGKGPGAGRSVYLRYYAPAAHTPADTGSKRKREETPVYEQGENTDNPLRCPVKLYEFYLSKCPESIKNRNDVFYLIPERSCVPDSPVWYSTGNLGIEPMTKMLNRLRVVREIQEALLHHQPAFNS